MSDVSTVATATVQFVTASPHFYCPACNNLLLEGFLTKCAHHLCYNCCSYSTSYTTHQPPTCPLHGQPLTTQDIFPDNQLTKQIANSLVYCNYSMDGTCKWTGPYSSLQHHLRYHTGHYLQCPLQCGHLVDADNLHQHINTSCTATIICKYCREEMSRCYYEGHLNLTCSQFPEVCVFDCGRGFIPRNKMKEHYQNCDVAKQAINNH